MEGAPEIVLSAANLIRNFRLLHRLSGGKEVFPVVKADAYGHGAVPVVRILEKAFSKKLLPLFCVARVTEAQEIRRAGTQRRILVLSHFTSDDIEKAKYPFELAVHSTADLKVLAALTPRMRKKITALHLNLNTGMNRLGFRAHDLGADFAKIEEAVKQISKLKLPCRGIMSHFACSEQENSFNDQQEERFTAAVEALRSMWAVLAPGMPFPQDIHMANSAAGARGLATGRIFTAFRPGIYLWGARHGSDPTVELPALRPVMRVRAPLRQIFKVAAGESVGYGQRFRASRETWVGTVAFGYADGLRRSLSRAAQDADEISFFLNGVRAPIIGTVSMDMTMVDLTDHPQREILLRKQERAELPWVYWISKEQTVETIAARLGTIPYEIFCSIAHRVNRVAEDKN